MSALSEARLARALREVSVRFARDSEGILIAQMVHGSHDAVPTTGWERVAPYWLVATHADEAIGALQVCYSSPIGRLEFLSFVPGLPFRVRAAAVRALLTLGSATLAMAGCHVVAGCVPFDQKAYRDVLKANGCTVLSSGNVLIRDVA